MLNIDQIISELTLEEKASLCSGADFWHLKGIERLGIPSIMVTDGPHGLRKQVEDSEVESFAESVPATCFPTASALAASWDRELIYKVGEALGEECLQEKVSVILGPGVNIKRSPLCGRNFEYLSEDPYLGGEIAKSHISGVQSKGIGTSLKHYAANNQEYRRMVIDAVIDQRALREIYLAGFEIAVKGAQPWTVMCAYNKVNGTYCSEHKFLMTDILKREWGHEGLVVTDWGAMNERVRGLAAGVELEMPGTKNGNDAKIVAAVKSGELDEEVLDQAVGRVLTLISEAEPALSEDHTYDRQVHHALARHVAGKCAVLLKNDEHMLPLKKSTKVALIGRFAKQPRYQGAGSSSMNPTMLDNLYDEVVKIVGEETITFAPGYPEKEDILDDEILQEAIDVAKTADVVVVCAGLTEMVEVEGVDREHMRLPKSHNALIDSITAVHPRVVVVLSNGSPVEMPWVDQVPAILEAYLSGQAGAGAVAEILYGIVNPSGKLAETFPVRLEDNPSYHDFPGGPKTVEYRESIYVGYRYYDTVGQEVLFPFGHGLSYTNFAYSDLRLSQSTITDTETLTVTFNVTNTGSVAGKEIVQLYVKDLESTAFRPEKELKGFAKVALDPVEETEVKIELDRRAFAFYNPGLNDWHVESGEFEILIGASSRDIRLSTIVQVESTQPTHPPFDTQSLAVYYDFPKGKQVDQKSFEALLDRPLPDNQPDKVGSFSINTPISDMSDSFIGRQLAKIMQKQINEMFKGQEETPISLMVRSMIDDAPLRTMLMFSNGAMTSEMLDALLTAANGKFFRGMAGLIMAWWENRK